MGIFCSVYAKGINEHAPVFGAATYTGSFPEDEALGNSLLQVAATDADAGETDGKKVRLRPQFTKGIELDCMCMQQQSSFYVGVMTVHPL